MLSLELMHAEYPVICPFSTGFFCARLASSRLHMHPFSAQSTNTKKLRDDLRSIYSFIANLSTSLLKSFQVCIAHALVFCFPFRGSLFLVIEALDGCDKWAGNHQHCSDNMQKMARLL